MNRRWVCESCGSGVHAPSRPRMDDVRRYCFPCSSKTGRLVQRVCPAAERARTNRVDSKQRRREAAEQAQAERAEEYRRSYPGQLHAAFERYLKLEAWDVGMRGVHLKLIMRNRTSSSGRAAYWSGRATLCAGTDHGDALYVLLHEMAHHADHRRGGRTEHHSERFWGILHHAVEEAAGRTLDILTDRSARRKLYAAALSPAPHYAGET